MIDCRIHKWAARGAIIVVVGVCGCSGSAPPPAQPPAVDNKAVSSAANPAPSVAVMSCTPKELTAEFKKDPAGAKQKYDGMTVDLSGVVQSSGFDIQDSAFVAVQSKKEFSEKEFLVKCILASRVDEPWAEFTPTQTIKVRGKVDPSNGTPILTDCQVIEKGPSPLIAMSSEKFAKLFFADAGAAHDVYREKYFFLDGVVVAKKEDGTNRVVSLKGYGPTVIDCHFEVTIARHASPTLEVGQHIRVIGQLWWVAVDSNPASLMECNTVTKPIAGLTNPASEAAPATIEVADLAKTFKTDEQAAQAKFNGRTIQFSGVIATIDPASKEKGPAAISFETGGDEDRPGPRVVLPLLDLASTAKMSVGQTIKVRGPVLLGTKDKVTLDPDSKIIEIVPMSPEQLAYRKALAEEPEVLKALNAMDVSADAIGDGILVYFKSDDVIENGGLKRPVLELMNKLVRITDLNAEGLSDAGLADLTGLTNLDTLSLNDAATDAAMSTVGKMKKLQKLTLSGKISAAGFAKLSGLTEMRSLQVHGSGSDSGFSDAAMRYMKGWTKLINLNLDGQQIKGPGLANLAGMTALQTLDLDGAGLTEDGLSFLPGLPKLKKLIVPHTEIGDASLKNMQGFPALQELDLTGTQVSDAGLQHLQGLKSLQHLDLQETHATGVTNLKNLPALTWLSLEGCQIGRDGLAGIQQLQVLEDLSLSQTQIGDSQLAALRGHPTIERLGLNSTAVTDAGLDILPTLPKLAYLSLADTKITDAGLAKLAKLDGLKSLGIRANSGVTKVGLEKLKQARPKLEVSGGD
jgi:Leucine-rich repeat (LRR) protein